MRCGTNYDKKELTKNNLVKQIYCFINQRQN